MVGRFLNYTFKTGLYSNLIRPKLIGMSVTHKYALRVVVTIDGLFESFPTAISLELYEKRVS